MNLFFAFSFKNYHMTSLNKLPRCLVLIGAASGFVLVWFVWKFCLGNTSVSVHNSFLKLTNSNYIVPSAPNKKAWFLSTTDDFLYYNFAVGTMTPNDDRLLKHIRSQIAKPSPRRSLWNGSKKGQHFSQMGESQWVDEHLKQRRDGFFVECGALNGQTYSNSLFFERERNWTGLLIEANPHYHRALLEMNRNAFVLSACLSPTAFPSKMKFQPGEAYGGLNVHEVHLKIIKGLASDTAQVDIYVYIYMYICIYIVCVCVCLCKVK